jgi:signal transduction histidine kinase
VTALLPAWTRTVRFRLTVTYPMVLFGLTGLVVAGVYLLLSSFLEAGRYKTLGMLRDLSLQAIAVLFVASLATGWWLAGRALRPVRRITSTTREISATDLSRRIGLDGPRDELRELAETIDGMLARLDAAFQVQRQLVDDASHELRNPLAVIQANVDAVLAIDDTTPAARELGRAGHPRDEPDDPARRGPAVHRPPQLTRVRRRRGRPGHDRHRGRRRARGRQPARISPTPGTTPRSGVSTTAPRAGSP